MWRVLYEWLRKAGKNPAVRRTSMFVARGGQAIQRARHSGGKVGVRIISNSPHWVVWSEGHFIAAFPEANPKPDLDTYLKKKTDENDVEKWLFDPSEVEKALRALTKRKRRGDGEDPPPPSLEG